MGDLMSDPSKGSVAVMMANGKTLLVRMEDGCETSRAYNGELTIKTNDTSFVTVIPAGEWVAFYDPRNVSVFGEESDV